MTSTIVTIKYINPARDGYKPSIKGEDGSTFGCKEEKLSLFEKGKTYRIEYSEKSWNGKTYRNVESAAPVETGGQQSSQTGAASPSMASHQGNGKDEQIFVCALLKEGIRSGQIRINKVQLWEAANLFRGLWRASFGTNTFHASDVQQQRTARG